MSSRARWLLLGLFPLVFVLVRAPFWSRSFAGEEGLFADITVNRPASPNYCLAARVHGQPLRVPIDHPLGLYESMKMAGRLASPFIPNPPTPSPLVVWRLRLLFAMFQLVPLVLLAVLWIRRPEFPLVLTLAALVGATPLSILTSTELQTDGSSGALMVGLLVLAIAYAARALERRDRRLLVALAALYLGLGKQEWSIVLVIAVALAAGWLVFAARRWQLETRTTRTLLLYLVGGLAAGHLCSVLLDPTNYVGGIGVMARLSSHWLPIQQLRSETVSTTSRLPRLAPALSLLGGGWFLFALRRGRDPLLLLCVLFASGLLAAYLLSDWSPWERRYFAPALIAAALALGGFWPTLSRRASTAVWALFAISAIMDASAWLRIARDEPATSVVVRSGDQVNIGVWNGRRLVWQPLNLDINKWLWKIPANGCVRSMAAALAWNLGSIDFVNQALAPADGKEVVTRAGGHVCP